MITNSNSKIFFIGKTCTTLNVLGNSLLYDLPIFTQPTIMSTIQSLLCMFVSTLQVVLTNSTFQTWRLACISSRVISMTGAMADLLGIFGIALERFIYIYVPLKYNKILTRERVICVIAFQWGYSIILNVVGVMFSKHEVSSH